MITCCFKSRTIEYLWEFESEITIEHKWKFEWEITVEHWWEFKSKIIVESSNIWKKINSFKV